MYLIRHVSMEKKKMLIVGNLYLNLKKVEKISRFEVKAFLPNVFEANNSVLVNFLNGLLQQHV